MRQGIIYVLLLAIGTALGVAGFAYGPFIANYCNQIDAQLQEKRDTKKREAYRLGEEAGYQGIPREFKPVDVDYYAWTDGWKAGRIRLFKELRERK